MILLLHYYRKFIYYQSLVNSRDDREAMVTETEIRIRYPKRKQRSEEFQQHKV